MMSVQWLPHSPEGKQLVRFGIGSAIAILLLLTALLALTLYLALPPPRLGAVLYVLIVGLPASIILSLMFMPFFARLNHELFLPLTRILDADRISKIDRTGVLLAPAEFPSGVVRELVMRRNQHIEALKEKDNALTRRSAEMEMLYELSRQLGLSREAPDIPSLALSFLSQAVDYDVACMLVLSDYRGTLSVRSRGPVTEALQAQLSGLAANALYEHTGILLETEALRVQQQIGDARASWLDGKVLAARWIPVTISTRTVGVMGVLFLEEQAIPPETMRMMNIVGQNASLALEKVQVQRIEETQRFRNVLENLAEGVVLVRQNAEWALATGSALQFHHDICGNEAPDVPEHWRRCPISLLGLDVFHSEAPITRELTRDDRTFILAGTFVHSSAAGERGTVVSIRDVSGERATQQKLFQASKLASLGELAAGVAHEVNNPLTGILGFTELLLARDDLTPPVAESLHEILALARRTSHITKDLLLFARVQREGGFQAVDVRSLLRDTVKLLERSYQNLQLEITADVAANDRLLAFGDHVKIQQIVTNLAQNAKDAITMAGKGSLIHLRAYALKDEVVLEVEDDGPGIPERIRGKILEPFFTTKPIGKGTGLGLAIVNRIVEEHKGRLAIDSEEGRGTTFRITLPAAPSDVEEAAVQSPGDRGGTLGVYEVDTHDTTPGAWKPQEAPGGLTPTDGRRGTVVVLDDEETVLKFITRTLQSEGFNVHTTTDAEAALDLIATRHPDLLFCDFRMPGLTGEDFYRRLVADDPKWAPRIVFLTGDASGDEIQEFLKTTGAPALSKPIGVHDLRAFVDKRLAELHTV